MKTLKNHILIFDNACPMCRAYSDAFVKTGMLDANGRKAYQKMDMQTRDRLNSDKARNEIALVNKETGVVTYGVDSILKIISNAYPLFTPLFKFSPFRWLVKKIYFFISYNRKVIAPGKDRNDTCVPDVNLKYRWAYILFSWLVTSFILNKYSFHLIGLLPPSRFFREFIICGGQIIFQSIVLWYLAKDKILQYIGNMMTISLAGALVLLLFICAGKLFSLHNSYLYAGFFMAVVAFMILEHTRRIKLLQIHWSATAGWIIYRLIVLGIII